MSNKTKTTRASAIFEGKMVKIALYRHIDNIIMTGGCKTYIYVV